MSQPQYDMLVTDLSTLDALAYQIQMHVPAQWVHMADRIMGIIEHARATLREAEV